MAVEYPPESINIKKACQLPRERKEKRREETILLRRQAGKENGLGIEQDHA